MSEEYIGEVSLKMPKAKISSGVGMRLQPKPPAFLVDAYLELPKPIPIGPMGIYGFRGLLGYRYVAEKEAIGLVSGQDTWYDYYKYPPQGVHISKFTGPQRSANYSSPFSFGAGAMLATAYDDGWTASARIMLLLSVPSLFLIEGRAAVLSKRIDFDSSSDPPFFAYLAWGDYTIEMQMGADMEIPLHGPAKGKIVNLYAEVQALFYTNYPGHWYVKFGTNENRVDSELLSLFTAKTGTR